VLIFPDMIRYHIFVIFIKWFCSVLLYFGWWKKLFSTDSVTGSYGPMLYIETIEKMMDDPGV
jgi:hypothetical protein